MSTTKKKDDFKYKPKPKNYEIVKAMYEMYKCGPDGHPYSLEEIGKAYRKSRQLVYGLLKRQGYKLRSRKLAGLQVIDGIQFTLTYSGYLRGTYNKKRILAHRHIWEKHKGPIPPGHVIYHKDGNKLNNDIKNLAITNNVEFKKIHKKISTRKPKRKKSL